jgi:hypothetical protein
MVAERCAAEPFVINQGKRSVPVTLSIGIAALRGKGQCAASLISAPTGALSPSATGEPAWRWTPPPKLGSNAKLRQILLIPSYRPLIRFDIAL